MHQLSWNTTRYGINGRLYISATKIQKVCQSTVSKLGALQNKGIYKQFHRHLCFYRAWSGTSIPSDNACLENYKLPQKRLRRVDFLSLTLSNAPSLHSVERAQWNPGLGPGPWGLGPGVWPSNQKATWVRAQPSIREHKHATAAACATLAPRHQPHGSPGPSWTGLSILETEVSLAM